MSPKSIKHLRTQQTQEPGGVIRYHYACGKSGTVSRESSADLDTVNCPACAARVPRSKLHRNTGATS